MQNAKQYRKTFFANTNGKPNINKINNNNNKWNERKL